jgi:acetyl-CoA acyltransferase
MPKKVYVVGVGMTKFEKPGSREGWDYPEMAREAGTKALADAGIDYRLVEQGYAGYVYGGSTSGQRALYELGMTGIPIVNVNNNCSTGSTALYLAAQAIRGGLAACSIALGFEKMKPGSLASTYDDRAQPMEKHMKALAEISEVLFPPAPWMFGAAGREHMKQYGSTAEHFAKIGYKNHKHSVNNPYAQFQESYTLDDILASRMIYDPLTKLQCSPTRVRRGDPGIRGLRRQARAGRPGGRDRRTGDDHRLRVHLRRYLQGDHRLRHERASRTTCLRTIWPGARGLPGDRAA